MQNVRMANGQWQHQDSQTRPAHDQNGQPFPPAPIVSSSHKTRRGPNRPQAENNQLLPPAEVVRGLDPAQVESSRLLTAEMIRGLRQAPPPPQRSRGYELARLSSEESRQILSEIQTVLDNARARSGNNRAGLFPFPHPISESDAQEQTGGTSTSQSAPPVPTIRVHSPERSEENQPRPFPSASQVLLASLRGEPLPPSPQTTKESDETPKKNNQAGGGRTKQLLPAAQVTRRDRSGVARGGDGIAIRGAPLTETQIVMGALHIRELDNTSVWITKLPPNVDYGMLLGHIRGAGRVRQSRIYRPNAANPDHAAAKVTFFTNQAARNLMIVTHLGGFHIDGRVPTVVWNRAREPEQPGHGLSRVLRISGPGDIVRRDTLEWLWGLRFRWNVEEALDVGFVSDREAVVWYSFACWTGEAELAKTLLERDYGDLVTVIMAPDPCGRF